MRDAVPSLPHGFSTVCALLVPAELRILIGLATVWLRSRSVLNALMPYDLAGR
jgi:hypothetical protein